MKKLLAVIKREYIQRVRSRMFVAATILGPVIMIMFTLVPAYIASIRSGGPIRIAVIDESGILYERFRDSLLRSREDDQGENVPGLAANSSARDRVRMAGRLSEPGFVVEAANIDGKSLVDVKHQVNERVLKGELDVYVIIPKDILLDGKAEFYGRNTGDIFTRDTIESRLSAAVRAQRLANENVPTSVLNELNRRVSLTATKVSDGMKSVIQVADSMLSWDSEW